MDKWRSWLNLPFGKKLVKYHRWNAWLILLLAITGLLLYFPELRGLTARFRVQLKDFHIFLGILSIFVLALYLPLLSKHVRQIWKRTNQRYNLWFVLLLLIGWSVSGIILWQYRSLPDVWSSAALLIHDLFTYIGVPYAIYHAISRSRLLKKLDRESRLANRTIEKEPEARSAISGKRDALVSRRTFIRLGSGLLLALGIGPFFYRWLKTLSGPSNAQNTKSSINHMMPEPKPLPQSLHPEKGGGDGTYRLYTVTDVPSFTSETWELSVNGLVNKPLTYSWKAFLKLPRKAQVRDFHCVTGWSVYHVTWEGVMLSDLLKASGVTSKAKYVKLYSGDGVYTDSLTLKQAHLEDVMVAVLRDGKPIPQGYGGPARLIVPEMYAYKSVKWLTKIELIDHDYTGYWEQRGYKKDAWYRG